jgi:hypothetical protein
MSRHSLIRQSLSPRAPDRRGSLSIALELFGLMLAGEPRKSRRGDRR